MHSKEEINQWLKDIGKTRQWLADQCGVKYLVVNNWFSKSRTIPKKALIIIDKLMSQPKPADDSQISIADLDINLKVSHDKFLEFNNYAKVCGMNIVDWIIYVLEYAGDNKELLMKRLQEEKNKGEMIYSPFFIPFEIFSKILFVVLRQPSTMPRPRFAMPMREDVPTSFPRSSPHS